MCVDRGGGARRAAVRRRAALLGGRAAARAPGDETVSAPARTGVGTRARAFSAGGGAHRGTADVNTAPRWLTCVRGGPAVSAGASSPHAQFLCFCARRAGRRRIWRAGGTARAVLLLWAGRCVRAFVCARKRGVFMAMPICERLFRRGGLKVPCAALYTLKAPSPSRPPPKLPLAPTSTKYRSWMLSRAGPRPAQQQASQRTAPSTPSTRNHDI
jgi:hypothetical protein